MAIEYDESPLGLTQQRLKAERTASRLSTRAKAFKMLEETSNLGVSRKPRRGFSRKRLRFLSQITPQRIKGLSQVKGAQIARKALELNMSRPKEMTEKRFQRFGNVLSAKYGDKKPITEEELLALFNDVQAASLQEMEVDRQELLRRAGQPPMPLPADSEVV